MKLGTEVGLGLGHIVLDGDLAAPQKGHSSPNFRPMPVVVQKQLVIFLPKYKQQFSSS